MSNVNKKYTDDELKGMSNEELAALGTELDDVTVAFRKERYPIAGDPAEKRAARGVNIWLIVSVLFALAFLGVYIFWPWEFKVLGEEGLIWHTLYTPLLGLTAGIAIIALGVAIIQFVKHIMPEEISVQRRHDGPSEEVDRRTLTALLNDSWKTSTLGRRKTMQGLLGGAAVLFGLVVVAPLGGMIQDPWRKRHELNYMGDGTLWTSGWTLQENGVKLYLARDTGTIAEFHEASPAITTPPRAYPAWSALRLKTLLLAAWRLSSHWQSLMSTTETYTIHRRTYTRTTCTPFTVTVTLSC